MIHALTSAPPLTEFAPTWNKQLWIVQYDKFEEIDTMRNWILDNEAFLIEKYAGVGFDHDGNTGLGKHSLTAQYSKMNLFTETKDIPEFQNLFKFIRDEYSKFMNALAYPERKCSMFAWANAVNPGQHIKKHNHGGSHFSYLSGNMHFDDYETATRYHNDYDSYSFEQRNVKGGLTFFPSYVYHDTTVYQGNTKRISIAFDLLDVDHLAPVDANRIDF